MSGIAMRAAKADGVPAQRVLVVGIGQIGTFAVRALLEAGHKTVAADVKPEDSFVRRYAGMFDPVQTVDIRERDAIDALIARHGPFDAAISAAGLTGDKAAADPTTARLVAVQGARALLGAAARAGIRRTILVSSLAVYAVDPNSEAPLREDVTLVRPSSHYGRLLAEMEQCVRAYTDGPQCTLLRVAGVYGPNRFGFGSHSARLIERLVYSAAQGLPIRLRGLMADKDDYVYVKDVGRAIARAAVSQMWLGDAINVGTGRPSSIADLLEVLRLIFGELDLVVEPPAKTRVAIARPPLDITRMEERLGPAAFPLAAGIRDFAQEANLINTDFTESESTSVLDPPR